MDISDQLSSNELELFSKTLRQDAIDGHYAEQFSDFKFSHNYLSQIQKTGNIPHYPASGLILVFRENSEPVCFSVVCSSVLPGFKSEILFFSTVKNHRSNGYGKMAVTQILNEVKGQSVLARCMPRSKVMGSLLTASNFKSIDLDGSKNNNYVHKNC